MSANKKNQTKNDSAWEKLFSQHQILEAISSQGYFEITSSQINEVRESRLMAKFDHTVNLPKIFIENRLSILPISRYKYVIGHFDAYLPVKYSNEVEDIPWELPVQLESIDYTNLYSESSALMCAFNAGIIDDLFNEETFYTVSGRMSTETFSFQIENITNDSDYPITVENSQCEIDGGLESENYFLLIEVKNHEVDDFLVRQLYYPYRLWSKKLNKPVIPILMTYSNDIFTFFVYKFSDENNYNSLNLIKQKQYSIAPEMIHIDDVSDVFSKLTIKAEPSNVPFPQADKFERVVDLLSLLVDKDLTKEEITANYEFDSRQTGYYTGAGRYLGLIEKSKDNATGEITFRLTNEGKSILKKRHRAKFLALINKILEYEVFYKAFELSTINGEIPSKETIVEIMSCSTRNINSTTIKRRARTVYSWIDWIWSQIED